MTVEGLTKVYSPSPFWLRFLLRSSISVPVKALDDVSLTIPGGTICAVLGPNGAGKSTLFRVLTGLTTPTSGSARISGLDVVNDGRDARRLIGWMPSGDQTLYLRMTCIENLRFHGRLQGIGERNLDRRIRACLEQVGLGKVADRVGFALSAGMRARLQLARAVLHRPRLLILDEPTAAVDPVGSYELLEIIQELVQEDGVSVLLSSHRLEEIEALHDQVVLLHRGQMVYKGDLDVFRKRYTAPQVSLIFASPTAASEACTVLGEFADVGVERSDEVTVEVTTLLPLGPLTARFRPGLLTEMVSADEKVMPLRDVLQQLVGGRHSND